MFPFAITTTPHSGIVYVVGFTQNVGSLLRNLYQTHFKSMATHKDRG